MNFKQCVRKSATLFRRSHIRFANVSLTRRSRLFAEEKSRPGNFKHQKVTYTAVFIVGRGLTYFFSFTGQKSRHKIFALSFKYQTTALRGEILLLHGTNQEWLNSYDSP